MFSLSRIILPIKDLEIKKFGEKYLFCEFSHNKFPICGKMVNWGGDSGSQTGSKTAPSGGFPFDFNIVGRLRPLHEASHVMGLRGRQPYRAVGLGLKSHNTQRVHMMRGWLGPC